MYDDMWERIKQGIQNSKITDKRKLYVMQLESLTESNPIVAKELQHKIRGRGDYMDALERVIVHLCEENDLRQSIIDDLVNEIVKNTEQNGKEKA